ncbi:MAG: DUF2231 domain-containing protein [Actinomycetota bacterium]
MARWFSWGPPIIFKGRKFKGLRGFAGKPFHPPLTDFPIAAYIMAATFDLISYLSYEGMILSANEARATDFFRTSTFVLIYGAIVSLGTSLTGFWDWLKSTPKHSQVWRTANSHMLIMGTVTAVVAVDIVLRLSYWSENYTELSVLVLSLIAATLVSWGSFYGGSLVFDYGFNVENATDLPEYHPSERDRTPTEKAHIES